MNYTNLYKINNPPLCPCCNQRMYFDEETGMWYCVNCPEEDEVKEI